MVQTDIQISTKSLFEKVSTLLSQSRLSILKNINNTMVSTYFEIGKMIIDEEQEGKVRAEYGKQIIFELSKRLTTQYGKGFSQRNLEQMRQFYTTYSIPQTLSAEFKLSWSHYLKLMRIEDISERNFYEIECVQNQWSLRELQRQFDSALYQRLTLNKNAEEIKKLASKGQIIEKAEDVIKDPYILEFVGFPQDSSYSESEFEQQLIDKLEHFLLELGKGYTFVGRQVRFTFDERHFRVDLVFYNRILQCFVLIDLKIGEITHQDIGQMQMYVNYYDRNVKLANEQKTIGILLCREKNDMIINLTLPEDNTQIFASKYQTVLPSKEELNNIITANYDK